MHLPTLDVGYQFVGRGQLVEFTLRSGLLWDGRLRVDDNHTLNLPTAPSWGATFEAGASSLWFAWRYLRSDRLSEFGLDFCSNPKHTALSLCVRGASDAEGPWFGDEKHRVLTGTLGIGLTMPR